MQVPGHSDILPEWTLSQARDASKAVWQQSTRSGGKASGSDDGGRADPEIEGTGKNEGKAKPGASGVPPG